IESAESDLNSRLPGTLDVSVATSNYGAKLSRQDAAEYRTIYPGSDTEGCVRSGFAVQHNQHVGMVCPLEPRYLTESSFDVFIELARRRPDIRILVAGGGRYRDLYRQKADSEGITSQVQFTGYIPKSELRVVYEKLDVFVAPLATPRLLPTVTSAMQRGI